jgi:hypothetical protein
MSEHKVSMWRDGDDVRPSAVWDIELSAEDIESLAAGFSPSLVRPDHLVYWVPLAPIPAEEGTE